MPTDPSVTPNEGPPEGPTGRHEGPDGSNEELAPPGADGPAEARTELPAPEPAAALCGFEHDQWDIVRMRRRCIAPAGHTTGQFAYDHGPWQSVPDAPSTPPAAPVTAPHRSVVAGEPESGQDGTAGRVAVLAATVLLRGREFSRRTDRDLCSQESNDRVNAVTAAMEEFCKALPADDPLPGTATLGEVHDAAVRYAATLSYDGCNAECRKAGEHTLRWGGCEHAVEPPPTVSLPVVYTDTDGERSIGFDRHTAAELAELIEPALHKVGIRLGPNALALLQRGEEVRLSAGEIWHLARAAADAIITHGNRYGS